MNRLFLRWHILVHKGYRGRFTDDEHKLSLGKYLLKDMYDGTEIACYDQLRLTKRNFHDLCAMLREKCGLRDSVYVAVEEMVAMFSSPTPYANQMPSTQPRVIWSALAVDLGI